MQKPVGFTAIVATKIQDAFGNVIANGTFEVRPTDANDRPITAEAGPGGPILPAAAVAFTNGTLPPNLWVPDTSLTRPANISYRFTITNAADPAHPWVLKGVQPSGDSFNLDNYTPNVGPQAIVLPGPPGPTPAITIGAVTTLAAGAAATVSVDPTSTPTNVVLNFGIPRGAVGAPGSISGGVSSILFNDAKDGTPKLLTVYDSETQVTGQ